MKQKECSYCKGRGLVRASKDGRGLKECPYCGGTGLEEMAVVEKTVEERAKEYADNEVPFDTTDSGEKLYVRYDVVQAYIAGARENGIEWHDLRKHPEDLPKDRQGVWTNKGGAYHDSDGWFDDCGCVNGVFAWCASQFKENKEEA